MEKVSRIPLRSPARLAVAATPKLDITSELILAGEAIKSRPGRWIADVLLIGNESSEEGRVIGVDFVVLNRRLGGWTESCMAAITQTNLYFAQHRDTYSWRSRFERVPQACRPGETEKVIRVPIAALDGPISDGQSIAVHIHDKVGPIWGSWVAGKKVSQRLNALLNEVTGGQLPISRQRHEWEQEAARRAEEYRRRGPEIWPGAM